MSPPFLAILQITSLAHYDAVGRGHPCHQQSAVWHKTCPRMKRLRRTMRTLHYLETGILARVSPATESVSVAGVMQLIAQSGLDRLSLTKSQEGCRDRDRAPCCASRQRPETCFGPRLWQSFRPLCNPILTAVPEVGGPLRSWRRDDHAVCTNPRHGAPMPHWMGPVFPYRDACCLRALCAHARRR